MVKLFIGVLVITLVGLFALSKIDPTNNQNGENLVESYDSEDIVRVGISGQIMHPGNYDISIQASLADLIDMAGGVLEDHDPKAYTATLVIGTRKSFYIPKKSQKSEMCYEEEIEKVNINSATSQELNEKTAFNSSQSENVVKYREENGLYQAIEDVLKVSGIGEATFSKVKDYICLS